MRIFVRCVVLDLPVPSFRITANGLHIAEGGEYEAQNIKLKQMYNRSTTVYFSTKPPLLAICCYVMCFLKS